MVSITHIIVLAAVKLLLVFAGLIYAGLVVTAYEIEGPHYRPRIQLAKPARSGERLLVWAGVKLLHTLIRFSRSVFNELVVASGDVGSWVVDRSSPSVQRKVRSRFL